MYTLSQHEENQNKVGNVFGEEENANTMNAAENIICKNALASHLENVWK